MPKLYKTHKLKYNTKNRKTKRKITRKHSKTLPLFDASKVHPSYINFII